MAKADTQTKWVPGKIIKCLTLEGFFTIGFAGVVFILSSSGGGNTFPDRRCILLVAPVIC